MADAYHQKTPIRSLLALRALLTTGRFDYADEKVCQAQIEDHLTAAGVPFEREFNLGCGYVDFYFPRSWICLEVKASTSLSKMAIFRQCERYCSSDQVQGLLLATGSAQGLPEAIGGKPVLLYQLGLGML